jgi:hypothetical protein
MNETLGGTTTSRRTFFRSFTGITCYRVNGSDPRALFALITRERRKEHNSELS